MDKKAFDNPEIQRYFNSLPPQIQENILQSGVGIYSVDSLRILADNLSKLSTEKSK